MALPRGIHWKDLPRKPAPGFSEGIAEVQRLLADDSVPPLADALALREQLHREVEAERRRQGELKLSERIGE